MRPDQETSIEFSSSAGLNGNRPEIPDDHPAADKNLQLKPSTLRLLAEIRADQNPVNGKIGTSAKPAKRALGSNW